MWKTLSWSLCLLLLGATPGLVACGDDNAKSDNGNDAGGSSGGISKADLDFKAFDEAVAKFLTDNSLKGASAVIVHKDLGVVHSMGYGEFAADRLFLIASSSKVMSVGVLMKLADDGKLDLDKPISTYLKDWDGTKPDLTVAQLVSNSSGLTGLIDNPLYAPYLCQYMEGGTLSDCAKTIYTADDAADRKPPDTTFRYGGGAWQLAGGIAEQVSGKKWAELIDETYVQPCGTKSIGYTNQYQRAYTAGGSTASGLAYPTFFMADVANLPMTDNPSIEGGAYTTAQDYGQILLMHLRGGKCGDNRVLSADAVARMQEDRIKEKYDGTTPDPTLAGYGLGWWVDREHKGVVGDAGAYGAMPWIDGPRDYAAIIILEDSATMGTALRLVVKPLVDAQFDAAEGN